MGLYKTDPDWLIGEARGNARVQDAICKAQAIFAAHARDKIAVFVSGGSDSDVMIDLVERIGAAADYIYIDVGLDYEATREHLRELEEKYGIVIRRERARMPVPLAVKKYGVPCFSKHAARMIERMQRIGFSWEDIPEEEIRERWPGQKIAAAWWSDTNGERYSIKRNKWLREFLIENPPAFRISSKCCEKSKRETQRAILRAGGYGLNCVGIRKAEGGERAGGFSGCYAAETKDGFGAAFQPLYWLEKADKEYYVRTFGVTHSRLYTEYGFSRTGCVCCPFAGRNCFKELEITRERDPLLYRAAVGVFGEAYEYMRRYYDFRKRKEDEEEGE